MSAPLQLGWKMSVDQVPLFWRLWGAACRGQGWSGKEAIAKRKEVLAELGFASVKHIDAAGGFDRVREHLEALAARVQNERPDAGERRRLLWNIDQARAELSAAAYPAEFLNKIFKQRFRVIAGVRLIGDLETEELLNLLRTLKNRLATWKQQQLLTGILRPLLLNLALHKAWPSRSARPASRSATGTASASAMHTLCSTDSELLPQREADLFLAG
jgi:hypothetical protein